MNLETSEFIPTVCVIEDDPIMGESLRQRLSMEGFDVDIYDRADAAYQGLQHQDCDIILCDIRLPDMNGIEFYQKLIDDDLQVPPIVFMTAHGSVEHAVGVMKLGATDYITKPFRPDELIDRLKAITIIPQTNKNDCECELGVSSSMLSIQKHVKNLARYRETPLLITGESGVGKEVVACYLHRQQANSGPYVAVNCSAIPESLIEAELFGHEKGAFTGASKTHKGVFEQAHGGTLLLDEIGDMPLFMQAKLLRVLQERSIKRVGGEQDIPISSRLIFATNKNLEELVKKGLFREDLYYRINIIHTSVPALRKRKEDIIWLAERFIKEHQENYPEMPVTLHESAKRALVQYSWPGNIRELKHNIERACIMSNNGIIREQDITPNESQPNRVFGTNSSSLKSYLEILEKEKIEAVLLQNDGCIRKTAEDLNICRKSLWEKMKKYGIKK